MPRKNYLFISDTNYETGKLTGAHKRFLEFVRDVSKNENVILISREIPQLKDCNCKKYIIKQKEKTILPSHIGGMIGICKILIKNKKNIEYDFSIAFGPIDAVCYKICGYNNIISLFREDYIGYRRIIGTSGIKMLYFKYIEKKAVKSSKKIIVQCEDDKKSLISRYEKKIKDLKSKIYIQTNNVNASWINKNVVRKEWKEKDYVTILFIGNFSNVRKGHSLLLPVIAKLISEGYKIKLYVAGDGDEFNSYKKKYNEYNNIVFLGNVKDITKYMDESDFEVVPSLMDSCPNTVLEGLNAGLAVYGSNVGGIKELLSNKNYLFELNENEIYKFIKEKIDSKSYIKDSKEQVKIKEKLTFNWSKEIKKIIEL